jgi:hypothetical protein
MGIPPSNISGGILVNARTSQKDQEVDFAGYRETPSSPAGP